MNPRTEALRFRIWQYAAPREWNGQCGVWLVKMAHSDRK